MKVEEYWHGAIKNYRYDGDASIICAPDKSSLKPDSGATEGVLD